LPMRSVKVAAPFRYSLYVFICAPFRLGSVCQQVRLVGIARRQDVRLAKRRLCPHCLTRRPDQVNRVVIWRDFRDFDLQHCFDSLRFIGSPRCAQMKKGRDECLNVAPSHPGQENKNGQRVVGLTVFC
jgi:hypothetical protein